MPKNREIPGVLRLAAAVVLGLIAGGVLFLIVALGIGLVNDSMGMQIPVNLAIGENLLSAILLVFFILICVATLYRQVSTTPSSGNER
jgi:hypothetical protein